LFQQNQFTDLKDYSDRRITELETALEVLQKQKDDVEEQLLFQKKQFTDLKDHNEKVEREAQVMQVVLTSTKKELEKLELLLEVTIKRRDEYMIECEDLKKKVKEMNEVLLTTHRQLTDANTEIVQNMKDIKLKDDIIEEERVRVLVLNGNLQNTKDDLIATQHQYTTLYEAHTILREEADRTRQNVTELESTVHRLTSERDRLAEELIEVSEKFKEVSITFGKSEHERLEGEKTLRQAEQRIAEFFAREQ